MNRSLQVLEPMDPHWAIEERWGASAFLNLSNLTFSQTMELVKAQCVHCEEEDLRPYAMHGRTALIPISGSITKRTSWLSYYFGGTSSERVMSMVDDALVDDAVDRICLVIDSPGGQVSGTGELADLLFEANRTKPVYAFLNGLGASAAYWLASQAKKVGCTPQSMVGSIGTYMTLVDSSKYYEEMGIKTLIFREGQYKGAGVEGTRITADQQAEFQREVSALNDQFLSAVARGRVLSTNQVRSLNDGRIHVGEAAKEMGLVDHVCSYQAFLEMIGSNADTPSTPAGAVGKYQGDISSMEKTKIASLLDQLKALVTPADANAEADKVATPTVDTPTPVATVPVAVAPVLSEDQKATLEAVPQLMGLFQTMAAGMQALTAQVKAMTEAQSSNESASYAERAEVRVENAIKARKITPANREELVKLASENRVKFEAKMEVYEASEPIAGIRENAVVNAKDLVSQAGSAVAEFQILVDAKVKSGTEPTEAYRAVSKENPALARRVRAEEISDSNGGPLKD